jgi:RPA family protein
MARLVGRRPVETKVSALDSGSIPIYNSDLKSWDTIHLSEVTGSVFPFTGSAIISGSLTVSGSTNIVGTTGNTLLSTNADTLIFTGSLYTSGSIISTGSLEVNGGITGSLLGTSSFADTASRAISSSYAETASYANNFTVAGTLTAQTIVAQTITSSTEFITGSTKFGSELSNTHQFTGSVGITGSLEVNGRNYINDSSSFESRITTNSASFATFSGSYINESSSFASRITTNSASFATFSGSYINESSSFANRITTNSASFATFSGSYINESSSFASRITTDSASFASFSGSYINESSSFASRITTNSASFATFSGSYINESSSFASRITTNSSSISSLSASFREFSGSFMTGSFTGSFTGSLLGTASYALQALTASNANTASYIINAQTASYVTQAQSASYWSGSIVNVESASYAATASNAPDYLPLVGGTLTGNLILNQYDLSAANIRNLGYGLPAAQISTDGNKPISIIPNVESVKFWNTSNVTIQDGGTHVDNGFRLDVSGSGRVTDGLTVTGSTKLASPNGIPLIVDHYNSSPNQNTLIGFYDSGSAVWNIGNSGTTDNFIIYNPQTFAIPLRIGQDNSTQLNGNLGVTGSLQVTSGITGSLLGTSSYAMQALSASYALQAVSASYTATASSADDFTVRGTLIAQTIVAQTITSSTEFITGSTKNGSLLTNTHQFTGSVSITGSLEVNGRNYINDSSSFESRITVNSASFVSFSGSYVNESSSFASRITTNSASFAAFSGSYINESSSFASRITTNSASISALSASFNVFSGSFMTGSFTGSFTGSVLGTSSYALQALTASNANTASSADNFTVRGTLTAQTIIAQTITSSVEYITGSTQFGSLLSNTHQFTGSVEITGSLSINGRSYTNDSSSFASRITDNSASFALFSGSYANESASFASRITTNSSSFTTFSGSYINESSSFASRITTNSASISNLSASFNTFSSSYNTASFTGSFKGDGAGLYNIPASGITGLNLSQIASGSATASVSPVEGFRVNTNTEITGSLIVTDVIKGTGSIHLQPDLNDSRDFRIYNTAPSDIHIKGNAAYSFFGDDVNYLKIDTNSQTITIEAINGVTITSSLSADSITGSLQGTASYAENANLLDGKDSSVFASTGSNSFSGSQTISSGFKLFTDAVENLTGNTLNLFGDVKFNGNVVDVPNDLAVTGSFVANNMTGSLLGTASYAISASHAVTALSSSYALNSTTSSYALIALSSSYALTASYATNITISGSINDVDYIDFKTSATVTQPVAGRLSWNNTDGTLDLGMKGGNVTQQIGQETFYEIRNETTSSILNGTSLYANGVTSGSGRITAAPFVADGNTREVRYLGLATENISTGVNGFVTHFGYVRGLDTRGTDPSSIAVGDENWSVGDILYAHPTVAGKLTNVKPKHEISVAIIIIRHQSTGILFVRPASYGHINDIHDVNINTGSLSTGDLLIYDSGSDYWTNSKQLSGSYGLTGSLNATSLTGSLFGTASHAVYADYINNLSSASFASTGSNTFIGTQTISGSLIATQGVTASLLGTASYAVQALSASYWSGSIKHAETSSYSFYAESVGGIISGSIVTTGSNNFVGNQTISGSLSVTGNLTVLGTASFTYVTASQIALSASFLSLNVFEPAERFGGIKVYDSGSLAHQATASLAWDSTKNVWIYQNVTGSVNAGGVFIAGPENTGSLGDEQFLIEGRIPKSVGENHIDNSIMSEISGSIGVSGSLVVTGSFGLLQSLYKNQNTSSLTSGTKIISTNSTSSYTSAFYNYVLSSGANARAGQFITVWNGSSINYTDVSTTDIGNTLSVVFTASLSGGNVVLSTVLPSNDWTIKTNVNLL